MSTVHATTPGGTPLDAFQALCAREFAGYTQQQMATKLAEATGDDWSPAMVRHMEKGKKAISVPLARTVCSVTGYPWAWFTVEPDGSGTGRYPTEQEVAGQDALLAAAA